MPSECIFCRIAAGDVPAALIWEDEHHVAFLSHRPNTLGFTVVTTKAHHPSYAFELSGDVYSGLMLASRTVGLLLDAAFADVGRTGLIVEGFGVDHVHTKLFPMHGTAQEKWTPISSSEDKYFDVYEGYLSSHDAALREPAELAPVAQRIRDAGESLRFRGLLRDGIPSG